MTSTYLKAVVLAAMLALLNACENDDMLVSDCDAFVQVSADKYQNGATEHYSIISASITNNCLMIEYSSSGCDGKTWAEELIDSDAILESFPIQRNLKMLLENEELCDAVFTKTVSFDLTPLQKEGYTEIILNIDGYDESLLYQYGNDSLEQQIQTKWNLVNINGGLMGMDTNFPEGSITWDFKQSKVVVVNNNPLAQPGYDGFASGTYDYSVENVNGYKTLIVNGQDLGGVSIKDDELVVDQRASDGFQIRFMKNDK